ncbi:MAG: uroporphyrinogen decarboxylase [Rhodobiaceae bacterium]|nr:uroporphyrinogen decarboxylase [Rhodobiaceae bacterium]
MSRPMHRLATIFRERAPIDIGTTSLTAFRRQALPRHNASVIAHPIYETLPISAEDAALAGSDFQRVGFVWPREIKRGNEFIDEYGVRWLELDGNLAPFDHPLEHAGWETLNRHPLPKLPKQIQFPDPSSQAPTILDPPCPGLLDTCFMLRNGWQFMLDLTENFRVANALLDWALETVTEAYFAALDALPQAPDIIAYGDDLGFESGMYLSDLDFRTFIFPRLQTLFSRIRKRTNALICFHSCGAISSIIDDICDLGVDMLNLDFYAKNVVLEDVRRKLPGEVILHAPVNLTAIGRAAVSDNRTSLAFLASDVAKAVPCINGPIDNLSTPEEAADAMRGVAFVQALSNDDLKQLRDYGPVKSIIQKAVSVARQIEVPSLSGDGIPFGELLLSGRTGSSPTGRPMLH